MNADEDEKSFVQLCDKLTADAESSAELAIDPVETKKGKQQLAKRSYRSSIFQDKFLGSGQRAEVMDSGVSRESGSAPALDDLHSASSKYISEFIVPQYVGGILSIRLALPPHLIDVDFNTHINLAANVVLAGLEFQASPSKIFSSFSQLTDSTQTDTTQSGSEQIRKFMFSEAMKDRPEVNEAIDSNIIFAAYEEKEVYFSDFITRLTQELPNLGAFRAFVNFSSPEGIDRLFIQYSQEEADIQTFTTNIMSGMSFFRESRGGADLRRIVTHRSKISDVSSTTAPVDMNELGLENTISTTQSYPGDLTLSQRTLTASTSIVSEETSLDSPQPHADKRDSAWESKRWEEFRTFLDQQKEVLRTTRQTSSPEKTETATTETNLPINKATVAAKLPKIKISLLSRTASLRSNLSSSNTSPTSTTVPTPQLTPSPKDKIHNFEDKRVFTESELSFIEAHWRPLKPTGQRTTAIINYSLKNRGESISPEHRFIFEAYICKQHGSATSYKIGEPSLSDKHHGTVVLAICNLPNTILVVEQGNRAVGGVVSIAHFEMDKPGIHEGHSFSSEGYHFRRFRNIYKREMSSEGGYYFRNGPADWRNRYVDAYCDKSKLPRQFIKGKAEHHFDEWRAEKIKDPLLSKATEQIKKIDKAAVIAGGKQQEDDAAAMYRVFVTEVPQLEEQYRVSESKEPTINDLMKLFISERIKKNKEEKAAVIGKILDETVQDKALVEKWKTVAEQYSDKEPSTGVDQLTQQWNTQNTSEDDLRSMFAAKASYCEDYKNSVKAVLKRYQIQMPDQEIERQFRTFLIFPGETAASYEKFKSKKIADIKAQAILDVEREFPISERIPSPFHRAILDATESIGEGQFAAFLKNVRDKIKSADDFLSCYKTIASAQGVLHQEREWRVRFVEFAQQTEPMETFLQRKLGEQSKKQNDAKTTRPKTVLTKAKSTKGVGH